MAMSWTRALGAMDESLDAQLARRQLENSGLMKILQQTEDQRATRESESARRQTIEEGAKWRADQNLQRQEEVLSEDARYRDLKKAEIEARAAAAKQREDDKAEREKDRQAAKSAAEEAKSRRDDPKLPNGVKQWLSTLPFEAGAGGTPLDIVGARRKVNQTWATLMTDHPDLDPEAIGEYLNKVYTAPAEDRQISVQPEGVMMRHPKTGAVGPVLPGDVAAATAAGYTAAQ